MSYSILNIDEIFDMIDKWLNSAVFYTNRIVIKSNDTKIAKKIKYIRAKKQ